MKKRLKIFMVTSDRPRPPLGGGVRCYHFAKAIAQISELHIGILMPTDKEGLPADLVQDCASISQIPKDTGLHPQLKRSSGHFLRILKTAQTLLAPWTLSTAEFVKIGRMHCLSHGEIGYANLNFGFARRVYAKAVEIETLVGTKLFDLAPARSFERYSEFGTLFSEIKKHLQCVVHPDVIWLEHSLLFPYAKDLLTLFPHAALVCNAHNIEYELHRRLGGIMKSSQARRWYEIQAAACRRMESRWFSRCDLIVCCSEHDKEMVLKIAPRAVVVVIPNGVDTSYFIKREPESLNPSVLFTGNFAYKPNEDAVSYFLREIFPQIRRELPNCQFCLAGAHAKDRFKLQANQNRHIEIVSDVGDLRHYFDKAWVFVVPLRAGSGTRLKILEAMAMSKPIVSTPVGAEGIKGENNEHFVIATDKSSFAASVVKLLKDPHRRRVMGAKARELVSRVYNWDSLREQVKLSVDKHVPSYSRYSL